MSRRGGRRRGQSSDSGVSGCVVIDKPAGCTSHDVVDEVRKKLGTRKVGHAGTLDPDATGVLVLGVGVGTKLLEFVTGSDKTYTTDVVFGVETDTLDDSGVITERHEMDPAGLSEATVQAAASRFVGDIEQIPPMVSAVRVDGKRLHELAREGKVVERKPRPVTVHSYDVAATDDPLVFSARIECSSGTYIRTLAADLGTSLGGGAHLKNLRRLSVGPFLISDAEPLEDFQLLAVGEMLRGMPLVEADDEMAKKVSHGQKLGPSGGKGRFAIADTSGAVIAVYEVRDGNLCPAKVLTGR